MPGPPETLTPFDVLFARAADRKGGAEAVERLMPEVKPARQLARLTDDRWLSAMTRRIFQAGFNWSVVENKWPAFEEAFGGFAPEHWAGAPDEVFDELARNPAIIRNGAKIVAVRANAAMLRDLAAVHGTAARAFAEWPDTDYVGLLRHVREHGSRLGGMTAQYLFRGMGKDAFVVSRDVAAALVREGVVDRPPTSKRDMAAVQAAFNHWHRESGRPLAHISRVLAFTVDGAGPHRAGGRVSV